MRLEVRNNFFCSQWSQNGCDMRRVYFHSFFVFSVVVKAFPQTPALDSDSILFLENRSCLGLVSAILSTQQTYYSKSSEPEWKKKKKHQPGFKSRPCHPPGLAGKSPWLLCLLLYLLTMRKNENSWYNFLKNLGW